MIRVLLVDDHQLFRTSLRKRLEQEDGIAPVGEAGTAEQVAPRTKVLVVSSQTAPSGVRQAVAAGAHGYVPKRASEAELIEAIRRVAAGERYVDPDLCAQLVVADGVPALEPLSDRERDALHLLALRFTNHEIGRKLYVSERTIDTHRAHIMRKLRLQTRAELVLFALANGLID